MSQPKTIFHDLIEQNDDLSLEDLEGFEVPHKGLEAWKYTSYEVLKKRALKLPDNIANGELPYEPTPIFEDSHKIFIVDFDVFYFDPNLNDIVEVVDPESQDNTVCLQQLSSVFSRDKLSFRIVEKQHIDKPIEMFFFAQENVFATGQIEISCEAHSKALIVQHFESEAGSFSNFDTKITLADSAELDHVCLQSEDETALHYNHVEIDTFENAHYYGFVFNDGGEKTRHEATGNMRGEYSSINISGVSLIDKEHHNDITLHYNHFVENCSSRQHFKTVLTDKGSGVFQGKIYVERDAQKTDGYQLNNALMLSDKAMMNSKPELEIYADDVKCSHGATTGQIDKEALFYLRSRGLSKSEAMSLLVEAFVGESIMDIRNERLQEVIKESASSWLSTH